MALADVYRGSREMLHAMFALLHGREFIGILRLPLTANAVVVVLLGLGGWLLLEPFFATCFAGNWWLLDGLRAEKAATGPFLWLLTTWLLLGPSLLDVALGVLHEPLRAATERTMLGSRPDISPAPPVLRMRDRARILAIALGALPVALLVVLIPWVGLPIVATAGAATAAVVWFEPPMAARGLDLPARLRVLWRNRWRALGAGAGMQLAAGVPFVNVLALTAVATVAATSAYLQFDKVCERRRIPEPMS